jgi:hypothetical protein
MNLQEQIYRIKSMMGVINEEQKTKPISHSVLRVPNINSKYVNSNQQLLNKLKQSELSDKVDLNLNPKSVDFISQLSKRLQDKGIEPYFYEYANDDASGGVSGGLTFYIPNTNVGVSYEPGTFGASLGNLSLGYTPSSKQMSANLIIPIGK